MAADLIPSPSGSRHPADGAERLTDALRSLAMTYIGARRAGGELRTRLLAIEQERAQLLGAIGDREYGTASDRELAEIDRVRRMIARSSAASSERVRALEAVIAAVAGNAVAARSQPSMPPPAAAPAQQPPAEFSEIRPAAEARGGWSPPSDAVVGSRAADREPRRLR